MSFVLKKLGRQMAKNNTTEAQAIPNHMYMVRRQKSGQARGHHKPQPQQPQALRSPTAHQLTSVVDHMDTDTNMNMNMNITTPQPQQPKGSMSAALQQQKLSTTATATASLRTLEAHPNANANGSEKEKEKEKGKALFDMNTLEPNPNLLDIYPAFANQIQEHFPGTVPLQQYFAETASVLTKNHNFEDENTMGIAAICRDEIVDPFFAECVKYWGKTFNCCSLAGFLTIGKTGLAAASQHVPIDVNDNLRRFVFFGMPHIAISGDGEIGVVYREGIDAASNACGALLQIVKELDSGKLNLKFDTDDIEQSLVRQKVLSDINFKDMHTGKLGLAEITKIACKLIARDTADLLDSHLHNPLEFEYAVQTGVQIHGPEDTDWIWPFDNYLVSPQNNFEKHRLNTKTMAYELAPSPPPPPM